MARKKTEAIWISYDLGAIGDYEGLYAWLDSHGAKECGDSVAFLRQYEYTGDLPESLRRDLGEAVRLVKHNRIYVAYQDASGKLKGKFLFGRRKRAPWEGFAPASAAELEDEG